MKRFTALAITALLAMCAPPLAAHGEMVQMRIDAKASKVVAVVAEPMKERGNAEGAFTITSGEISGDPSNPAGTGSLTIVLDASSYDSGNPFRDDAVVGRALQCETYPTITFKSTGLQNIATTSQTAGTATVMGDLTLHGTTHPLSVPFRASLDATKHFVADGEVTFRYADFGVKVLSMLGSALLAGEEVTVRFHIVAVPIAAGG